MNKIKKIFILIFIFCFLNANVSFAKGVQLNAGTVGAVFLRLGVGARAIGMGNTFTAIADGINATYGNPAGVINLRVPEANLMHNKWLADISYGYFGYAQPLTDKSAIAGSIIYVDYGSFEGYDKNGYKISDPTARDQAIALTYGRRITEKLIIGANTKIINERYENEKANGMSFDAGFLYRPEIENLTVGFAVQNLGKSIAFVKDKFKLPLTYRFGICYTSYQEKLITGFDILKARDTDWSFSAGVEWKFYKTLALRAGYNSENDIGDGWSGGLGFYISKFVIDYAYSPFGALGDTHRYSLTYKFPER